MPICPSKFTSSIKVLVELYSTEPMLKNILKYKITQTKQRLHIAWVHVYENATNVLNKVPIYPCKFTSSIKLFWLNSTVPNSCLKTLKNVTEFKRRNVSIFSGMHVHENELMFLTKC